MPRAFPQAPGHDIICCHSLFLEEKNITSVQMEATSDFGGDYYNASARRKNVVQDEDDILYGSSEIGEKEIDSEDRKTNPDLSSNKYVLWR